MTDITIDVSIFSSDPWGRDESDNTVSSGRAFRLKHLLEPFNNSAITKITVDFSKLDLIPDTAFLGGAFVGLVKENGFSYENVMSRLNILPKDGFLPQLVQRILELAQKEEIELAEAQRVRMA
ncbi:hypothetical protein [Actinobacillus equuli]|uniref:hypothetical protein n=1 Tax=Actinobacillus equuli TaxID=718 RepID=UPI0024427DAD|nr:hypothetical protein [Actinobacillus equuli]WGE53760.1 hypothetical protein NYR69_04155 [Actinobacillus equuli subsp. haemolyticus]WGE74197.1 hypothetical protein NYR80_04145 [Actinobacillus equuli subsp. haemolyticus]